MIAQETRPPVVVLGAGIGGLVSVKSCLEEGLPVICFEKRDCIGGIWAYSETECSCTKSTYLNSSKEWTAFSDFLFPDHFPNYMKHNRYLDYLKMYAEHFKLLPHIRFRHTVLKVFQKSDFSTSGQWIIRVTNDITNTTEDIVASAVMVCTGLFATPKTPNFQGLEKFTGKVITVNEYREPTGMEDKNVLVVGSGNSAMDTAVDIGHVAKQVYYVLRKNLLIVGRIGSRGYPLDAYVSRIILFLTKVMPAMLSARMILYLCGLKFDRDLYNFTLDRFKLNLTNTLVNDILPLSILNGSVVIKNPIHHFTAKGVVFQGEEQKAYPLDAVVFATGYQLPSFSMIDAKAVPREVIQKQLFLRVFPINLAKNPTLAFIGCVKFNGPNGPMMELQARWAVQVFAKKVCLPPVKIMLKELEKYNELLDVHGKNRQMAVMEYMPLLDRLAMQVGCKPNMLRLLVTDPVLFWGCLAGSIIAAQYRLVGPHPWPGARDAILNVSQRMKAPFRTRPMVNTAEEVSATNGTIVNH